MGSIVNLINLRNILQLGYRPLLHLCNRINDFV